MSPGAHVEVDEVEDTSSSGDGGRHILFVREMRGFRAEAQRARRCVVRRSAPLDIDRGDGSDRYGRCAPSAVFAPLRDHRPAFRALLQSPPTVAPAQAGVSRGACRARELGDPSLRLDDDGAGGWIGRLGRDAVQGGATGRAWGEAIDAGTRRTACPIFRRPIRHLRCGRSNMFSRSRHSRYAAAACRGRAG